MTWTTTSTDAPVLTVDQPTVKPLNGRRLLRSELEARHVYVKRTIGQCRRTRRNNLRVARIEARRAAEITRLAGLVHGGEPGEVAHARSRLKAMKPTAEERRRLT